MSAVLADPMAPDLWRVQHIRRETPDTFTLELASVTGNLAPSFAAGQFNMLYIFGVGEVPISISGDPTRGKSLVHTVRAVGQPLARSGGCWKRYSHCGRRAWAGAAPPGHLSNPGAAQALWPGGVALWRADSCRSALSARTGTLGRAWRL